jgi:hypothetical protein
MILQLGGVANLITGISAAVTPAAAESAGIVVDEDAKNCKLDFLVLLM